MKTEFDIVVYLDRRFDWIARQIRRAAAVALPTLSFQECQWHTAWYNEAIQLHSKALDEKSARRIMQLFMNISTQLEKHVPGVAALVRELNEAANK